MTQKNQYQADQEKFAKFLSKFTGINKKKLNDYLKENPVNMIFEHPATLDLNEKQLENLSKLMELKGLYSNLKDNDRKYVMNSPYKAGDYFTNYYPELKDKEYVACSYLDTKLQVIKTEIISEGTVNSAMLVPREVAKKALLHDASSVMLAHNHPSGQTEPSLADIQTTKNVQDALGTLNIQLLDHVIIGSNSNYRSLKEDNYINEEKGTYHTEGLNNKLKKQEAQKIQRITQMER